MNPALQQIMRFAQMAKGMQNPQAFIAQLSQQNPQIAAKVQGVLQSGQSPQAIAMQMCQQNGIDPNQIMSMFGGK